jgi:hypothetical protein
MTGAPLSLMRQTLMAGLVGGQERGRTTEERENENVSRTKQKK